MCFVAASLVALAALLSPPALAARAIDFRFIDTAGKSLRLSDFHGKWVLVNFWTPGCSPCQDEVPVLNTLNRRDDVVVIGVGLDYGPDDSIVHETAGKFNFNVTAIVAGGSRRNQNSACRQVGPVTFYPTSYLYDPDGEIVMFIPGRVKEDRLLKFMGHWTQERTKDLR